MSEIMRLSARQAWPHVDIRLGTLCVLHIVIGVLHGSPKSSTAVLQRTQNSLAGVVLHQSKYTNATPLLKSLHWLPVQQRIQFKLAVVIYKVKSALMPAYLDILPRERVPTRKLRSSSQPLLDVTRIKTLHGQRAFRILAPNTWNSLPVDIQLASSLTIFSTAFDYLSDHRLDVPLYLRTLWHVKRRS